MTPQELIVYFIFLPPVIIYGASALIFLFIVLPIVLTWWMIQDATTKMCRRFGWRRPNWAVGHMEEPGFYPYEGA